ncbi:MAG: (d)CMP kinase [Nocardiopsaceae bacterium]|nr:(d)CMP kinase [Nocardiopsaceae bacterium]
MRVGISTPSGLVVAVDGPSGSGKTSTSRGVARALGLRYLDTGAMYRALTWWFIAQGAAGTGVGEEAAGLDEERIAARVAEPRIEVSTDPDDPWTRVDGRDVSDDIRTSEVTARVSSVARVPAVRERLIGMQREIIADAEPGIVAEGRDIGTVVAPSAQLKVFLTAASEARARRRAAERGDAVDDTEADQARRDRLDAAQSAKAGDAVLIDATDLTLEQVVGEIAGLARRRSSLACTGDAAN